MAEGETELTGNGLSGGTLPFFSIRSTFPFKLSGSWAREPRAESPIVTKSLPLGPKPRRHPSWMESVSFSIFFDLTKSPLAVSIISGRSRVNSKELKANSRQDDLNP